MCIRDRAVASGRYCTIAPELRASTWARLGDLYYDIGKIDEAARCYCRARRTTSEAIRNVELMRKMATLQERRGSSAGALRWLRRGGS